MKSLLVCIFLLIAIPSFSQTASVGIGTTSPNAGAVMEMRSSTQAVLLPRLTSTAMNSVVNPEVGMMVFNVDSGKFYGYSGYNTVQVSQPAPYNATITSSQSPNATFGQSFTMPSQAPISSVDVTVGTIVPYQVQHYLRVTIVSGSGLGGTVLAYSPQVFAPDNATQSVRFTFPTPFMAQANTVYTLVVYYQNQTSYIQTTLIVPYVTNGTYSGGTAYAWASIPIAGSDLVFSINTVTPAWRPLQVQ